jgi:hypothetical protein
VEQHQRRAVTTPVERPDGEAVVLDRPLLRLVAARHPGHATAAVSAQPARLADPHGALGILPNMPTAAGNRLRCEKCETEIIVVKGTDADVSCCGQPMAAREG